MADHGEADDLPAEVLDAREVGVALDGHCAAVQPPAGEDGGAAAAPQQALQHQLVEGDGEAPCGLVRVRLRNAAAVQAARVAGVSGALELGAARRGREG